MRRFALVEKAIVPEPGPIYYGIGASRAAEPLDQLDVMLLVSRLRRIGLDANLTIFVAGRYSVLNGADSSGLIAAEERKLGFLRASASALGVPAILMRTDDLWEDPLYWESVARLKDLPGIITFRTGRPFSEVAPSLGSKALMAMPDGLLDSLGGCDAPSLYTLFEVAEAEYFKKARGIRCKVGPASEQEYDAYIGDFMGILQLSQPLDFRSKAEAPRPLTPYIGRDGESRLFISDSKAELLSKVCSLAQRCEGRPVRYGGFMDPFARLSILAAESASAADSAPVRFCGQAFNDGAGALRMLERSSMAGLLRFAPLVAECLWAYVVRPIQSRMREVAS